jgi:formylglycine-generating enzyme
MSLFAQKKMYKNVADHWAAIPAGELKTTSKDSVKKYVGKSFKGYEKDSVSVNNFWMSKTEITNFEYAEFVYAVKQSGDTEKLKKVLPDTLVWRNKLSFNEPYVEYYFRHPAYKEYPVVGVSHEAALLYCAWLTEIYNTKLKELFPKFNAKKIEVRLPTLNEWMWAAKGGLELSPFPWGGPYIRNAEGEYLGNFRKIGDGAISYNAQTQKPELKSFAGQFMGVAGSLYENANVTAPVKSYWPNNYGLYNMGGNVSEMIDKPGTAKGGSWFTCGYDLQIEAPDPFEGDATPKSHVGFRPIFVVIE